MNNIPQANNDSMFVNISFNIKRKHRNTRTFGEVYMLLTNIVYNSVANFSSLQIVDEFIHNPSILVTIKIDYYKNQYKEFIKLVSDNYWLEQPVYVKEQVE